MPFTTLHKPSYGLRVVDWLMLYQDSSVRDQFDPYMTEVSKFSLNKEKFAVRPLGYVYLYLNHSYLLTQVIHKGNKSARKKITNVLEFEILRTFFLYTSTAHCLSVWDFHKYNLFAVREQHT